MAQTEDTELRDLVIEALEKNGSLAKIRALLRANIFLAFEDECENVKQNDSLDKILLLPEGKLCLSIIHEFLDFCNLRNTLFVYKSETRQGKAYTYEGRKSVSEKVNIKQSDKEKEPILLTLINNILKLSQKNIYCHNEKQSNIKRLNRNKNVYKGDQNSTYIVNEDSSTTSSQSQSDNSSDEKNKLDLRLTLDNSDTDTSSESVSGRNRSEYIPNKYVCDNTTNEQNILNALKNKHSEAQNNSSYTVKKNASERFANNLQMFNNSNSESTSYVELKPFNSIDAVLINTTGLPLEENKENRLLQNSNSTTSKVDTLSQIQTLSSNSVSMKKDSSHNNSQVNLRNSPTGSYKYDEMTDYSYDFTSPPISGRKGSPDKESMSPKSMHEDSVNKSNVTKENQKQNSQSSQSSVSISDVADLISEKSSNRPSNDSLNYKTSISEKNKSSGRDHGKVVSDDSGDFSESPIPSLSNLSLDIHTD